MKNRLIYTLLLLVPFFGLTQNIEGFIFDEDGPVEGASVYNASQIFTAISDLNGKYELRAAITDTLIITSALHKERTVAVTNEFIENAGVITLELKATNLDEVEINVVIQRIFDSIAYQTRLNEQTKLKIGSEKALKSGQFNEPTMDLLVLAKAIGFLSNKKEDTAKFISSEELKTLFEKENVFTYELLEKEFNIPSNQHQLFFEYCSVQDLPKALLDSGKYLQLLSAIEKQTTSFKSLLAESSQD